MKRTWIILLAALLLAGAPTASAHEGEKHEDIREGAPPAAEPTASPRAQTREVTVGPARWHVEIRLSPAEPAPDQDVQAELTVHRVLDPPDPLLGGKAPLDPSARISARLDGPTASDLGDAHAEEREATWGVHFKVGGPGRYRLRFQVAPPDTGAFEAEMSFDVVRAPARQAAWYGAWAVLAVALVGSVLLARKRRYLPLLVLWLAAGVGAGALYTWSNRAPAAAPAPPERPHAAQADGGVQVPTDLQRELGMTVEPAELQTVDATITVPGQVVPPQDAVHTVHAPRTAQVVTSSVRAGQEVVAGQVLAELMESLPASEQIGIRGQEVDLQARRMELERGRLELRSRLAALEGQRRELQSRLTQRRSEAARAESLFAIQVVPRKDLEAARFAVDQAAAQVRAADAEIAALRRAVNQSVNLPDLPAVAVVRRFSVTAPVSGVVTDVDVAPGEVVDPSKQLVRIVNMTTVWVRARVPENDLALARRSGSARVRTVPYPGPFAARLVLVESRIDPQTRTAGVIYQLPNPGGQLLENMAAEVELVGAQRRALTIPKTAVLTVEDESRVFVRTAPDRFEVRTVRLGDSVGNRVLVLAGLEPGSGVVTRGASQLASELARRGGAAK